MASLLRVIVADRSATYRIVLSHVVKGAQGMALVATVSKDSEIWERLSHDEVDLVVLSDEFETDAAKSLTAAIRKKYPLVKVIWTTQSLDLAVDRRARETGALQVVLRAGGKGDERSLEAVLANLSVRPAGSAVSAPQLSSRPRATLPTPPPPAPARELPAMRRLPPTQYAALAVASSTGGPGALTQFFSAIKATMRLPMVLVQHMPAGYTRSLATQLSRVSPVEVREAEEGDLLVPGVALLAPGGRHMEVVRSERGLMVRLHDGPMVNQCRPSADVLFQSLALSSPGPVLNVVLTGMGSDGALGVGELRKVRGYNLSQDEATCVVYGMPKAVADLGYADEILPLDQIAGRVNALGSRPAMELTR